MNSAHKTHSTRSFSLSQNPNKPYLMAQDRLIDVDAEIVMDRLGKELEQLVHDTGLLRVVKVNQAQRPDVQISLTR